MDIDSTSTHLWYTVGPASAGRHTDLLNAGATGVRLTFSYGTDKLQADRARALARESIEAGLNCLILADLPGDKPRFGYFLGTESVSFAQGEHTRLIVADSRHPRQGLPVPLAAFVANLREGNRIVIGDGAMELEVVNIGRDGVDCVAVAGGIIEQRRGLAVLGSDSQASCLTEETMRQLGSVAREPAFSGVMLSFVRSSEELSAARSVLDAIGRDDLILIAKIETEAALGTMREICAEADLLIAARGDLALALPLVELPGAVQTIADTARATRTPWILATQLMEGLEYFAIPTRAEICDLSHWRNEGCAGALLARETAFGRMPVHSVECVRDIMARWPAGAETNDL